MRLEARDRRVLAEALLHRVIRRADLQALGHFGSISRCNARLKALADAGFLKVIRELDGVTVRACLYSCTAKGSQLASEELCFGLDESRMLQRHRLSNQAIRHSLRCLDLHVQFRNELTGKLVLLRWFPELLCHHQFSRPGGPDITIKPDGLALLGFNALRTHVFIEVDLGNVSLTRLSEKLSKYSLYRSSGAFSDAYGCDRFAVMFATTDERRLSAIRALPFNGELILTTWKRLAEGLNAPIWTSKSLDRAALVRMLQ